MEEKYIIYDHAECRKLTLKWWEEKPENFEDCYEYAWLQFRLKDFKEMMDYLKPAAEGNVIPALYLYGYCLNKGLGTEKNCPMAQEYFRRYLEESRDAAEPVNLYRRGICYARGYGTQIDEAKAKHLLNQVKDICPEAMYELGLAYRDGRLGCLQDREQAKCLLKQAHEQKSEYAVFALYEMYQEEGKEFPYMREITEAYSYQIGRYARAAHVHPTLQAYQFMAKIYLHGFPGDTGEDDARFKRKADNYIKKMNAWKAAKK